MPVFSEDGMYDVFSNVIGRKMGQSVDRRERRRKGGIGYTSCKDVKIELVDKEAKLAKKGNTSTLIRADTSLLFIYYTYHKTAPNSSGRPDSSDTSLSTSSPSSRKVEKGNSSDSRRIKRSTCE